jgi:hypothetical protein
MMGGHMPENDPFTLSVLTNQEIIEVNQNSVNNHPVKYTDSVAVWIAGIPEKESKYLAVFNLQDEGKENIRVKFADIDMDEKCHVRDLWEHLDLGVYVGEFSYITPPHGAGIFRLDPIK